MAFAVPALAIPLENTGLAVSSPFINLHFISLGVGPLTEEVGQPQQNSSSSAEPDCDDEEDDDEEDDESDQDDEA